MNKVKLNKLTKIKQILLLFLYNSETENLFFFYFSAVQDSWTQTAVSQFSTKEGNSHFTIRDTRHSNWPGQEGDPEKLLLRVLRTLFYLYSTSVLYLQWKPLDNPFPKL